MLLNWPIPSFLEIAYGSAKEVEYQLSLARRLEYLPHQKAIAIETEASGVARILNALITGIRHPKPKA
jgi:four helix bundle protein